MMDLATGDLDADRLAVVAYEDHAEATLAATALLFSPRRRA
jgi:hypothetical protein